MYFTIPLGQDANFEFGNLTRFTLHRVISTDLPERNYFSFWLGWVYITFRFGRATAVTEGSMKLYLCLLSKQTIKVERKPEKATEINRADWQIHGLRSKLGWLRQAIFLPHFNDGSFRIL